MELKDVIENRTSVRSFTKEPVNIDDIKEMVRLAAHAPSVNNYQPWKFIAITNKELLENMAEKVASRISDLPANNSKASDNIKSQVEWFATFFRDAPALIAITMETYETVLEKGVNLTHEQINEIRLHPDLQSAGACMQNLLLAATDMGYGACWLSAPMIAVDNLEYLLKVEKNYKLISFAAIGRPVNEPSPKSKKSVNDILTFIE